MGYYTFKPTVVKRLKNHNFKYMSYVQNSFHLQKAKQLFKF